MRIKIFVLGLFFSLSSLLSASAQEKTYRKEKMNVMGYPNQGYSTSIPFSEHKTRQYLSAFLNENGKVSEKRNFIEIKEMSWKRKEDPTKVYAMVLGDSVKSRIWIGYPGEASEELVNGLEQQMENLPFLMNRYHLQFQIKEAEEATSYLSRELRNAQREEERLNQKLQQNTEEKVRLEQALEQNAQDKIRLEQDLIHNDQTQEERTRALEEVKKQLELLKERLSRL